MKQIIAIYSNNNPSRFLSIENCEFMMEIANACNRFIIDKVKFNTGKCMEHQYPAWQNDKMTIPQLYKRNDLYQWSEEARKRGDKYFYARPVDPKNPYGKLELCEPDYHYETHYGFSKEFYEGCIEKTPERKIFFTNNEMIFTQFAEKIENYYIVEKDYIIVKGISGNYSFVVFTPVGDERYEKIVDNFLDKFKLCN